MPIWIWITTFLKGFLPIDGKRIGKILWVAAICLVCLIAYNKFTTPTHKTTQSTPITHADTVNIMPPMIEAKPDVFFFGLKLWRVKVGISMLNEGGK